MVPFSLFHHITNNLTIPSPYFLFVDRHENWSCYPIPNNFIPVACYATLSTKAMGLRHFPRSHQCSMLSEHTKIYPTNLKVLSKYFYIPHLAVSYCSMLLTTAHATISAYHYLSQELVDQAHVANESLLFTISLNWISPRRIPKLQGTIIFFHSCFGRTTSRTHVKIKRRGIDVGTSHARTGY